MCAKAEIPMLENNNLMCAKAEIPMLENNNLSYTSQNHSSVTILKHFINRWQMNITAEF